VYEGEFKEDRVEGKGKLTINPGTLLQEVRYHYYTYTALLPLCYAVADASVNASSPKLDYTAAVHCSACDTIGQYC
jgi:hypothetical protein